ncbi:MAG TPA: CHASE2 domain-containing protein, partial [Planctomycetota bacterium]|nr:CHASE2 domain-containing protein [Planctomycetota bacterium]
MSANPPTQELRRTPLRLRLLWGAVTGLIFGAIALASSRLDFFEGLEGITLDLRQQLLVAPTPASGQVAVILIDEYSIQQLRRKEGVIWPWPRDVYVPLILYLKRAGARAIVFDLIFSEPGQRKIDAALAEAAQEAGNVVFASQLEVSIPGVEPLEPEAEAARIRDEAAAVEKGRVAVDGWPHPPRPDITRIVAPLPELTAAARGVGFATVREDAGGTVRRAELCYPYPDASSVIGSLPLLGALAALGAEGKASLSAGSLRVGGRRIPLGAEGRAFIRFYGKETTLQMDNAFSIIASFVALEEGKAPVVDPARFAGKVVFIGENAAGIGDIVSVPVSNRFPGTEFMATVCANILGGEFLEELGTP